MQFNNSLLLEDTLKSFVFFYVQVKKLQMRTPIDTNVNDKSPKFTWYELFWLSGGNR